MDPITSLSLVRDAVTSAIGRLEAIPEDDKHPEFAQKERAYLKGVIDKIDADISQLREAL